MSTPEAKKAGAYVRGNRQRAADKGGALEDVTGKDQPKPTPTAAPQIVLPDKKTAVSTALEERIIYLYGAEGIGKSTLAAELDWLFFDTEGTLGELEVFRYPVGDWNDFRLGVAEVKKHPGKYGGFVIDTYDSLVTQCRGHVLAGLGIPHETALDYGAGWDAVRNELSLWMNRLASLPGGLLVVGHDNQETIKLRNQEVTKFTPAVNKSATRVLTTLADLVILGDYEEDDNGERRVFRTKPSRYWVAKERGPKPRLPEVVDWPYSPESGWAALKAAWEAGDSKQEG